MKKIICMALVFLIFSSFGINAYASDYNGFKNTGDFSESRESFGFDTYGTVIVYNNEYFDNPDFDAVWPGSTIYIPVYMLGASGQPSKIATDKNVKENEVTLSYKAVVGDRYIDGVELVDAKKAKIAALDAGMYAKINVSSAYTGSGATPVNIKLVLSVKKISYPETQIELDIDISNRLVLITEDTVYPAQSPTHFRSLRGYGGAATFDFGNKIRYNTRVSKGTSYYLSLDRSDQQVVKRKYPDAYLEFYNFQGDRDGFEAGGILEIPIDRAKFTPKDATSAQVYVYEIENERLIALDERTISFDGKKNMLMLKTSALGNYVVSGNPLLRDIDDDSDAILYTGYASETSQTAASQAAGSATNTRSTSPSSSAQTVQRAPLPQNDNVNTGLAIEADNLGAVNPETSDVSTAPAIILMLVSALAFSAALASPKKIL